MKRFIILLVFCFLGSILQVFAQKDTIDMADNLVDNEDFQQAIALYKKILSTDSLNPSVNFKLGYCYLNSSNQKKEAIKYFKKSQELNSKNKAHSIDYIESSFYLARAYRITYEPDSAIKILNELKTFVKSKKLLKDIDKEYESCQMVKQFTTNPVTITIKNLGLKINSSYADHSPVLSVDESQIFFTSRREGSTGGQLALDGQYYEDIFVSEKNDGVWGPANNLGAPINTNGHEATISVSIDGTEMFIYKDEDDGSIYYSIYKNEKWSAPIKLGLAINTKYRETHASLSADGNYLYFTSDRPGGFGGLDIYVAKKQTNGEWGEVTNLGQGVNTAYDEEGPFIHPDGKTIYFSSKGHPGLGGYDIFKSEASMIGNHKVWGKPENIGYPINTTGDDAFFVMSADGQRSYYASVNDAGFGRSDIYMLSFTQAQSTNVTVMTGKGVTCNKIIPEATVTVVNEATGETVSTSRVNPKNGKFLFVVNRGANYNLTIEVNSKIVVNENFKVSADAPSQQLYKTVKLDPEVNCGNITDAQDIDNKKDAIDPDNIDEFGNVYDQNIKIQNVLFPFGMANEIAPNKSLDDLANYLKQNSEAIVEIGAYADAIGTAISNIYLTERRGAMLLKYMTDRGVNSKQLVIVGYGEENPIAISKNTDGTYNYEAHKYNRRVEFKVIKQGKSTLLIKPITDIPEKLRNKNYVKKDYKKSQTPIETDDIN